ncbi:hypothetical protein QLX67_03790 [Balneolaceae bacterium ANBcel3]|nr:hypothetical protein [Balneolaceae bacterium ANBcel3]
MSKQTSFFYRFNSEELEIITIFDNRRNPDNIDSEIETYVNR